MSTKSKVSKKSSAGLAVLFFLPAFMLFLMWITLGWRFGFMSEGEKKDSFLSSFPEWMQNFSAIHILSIVFCIVAISFAAGSFKKKILWIRILMMVIVMFSIFIILFDIAQLI
ncbi:MAG: hypothetical protein ABIW47_11905 [Ginsengibacter sp.]|jgi:hypothetical protein